MNLLLLRGLIRSQFHWWDFEKTLAKIDPSIRPFYLDFPGTGTNWNRRSPLSVTGIQQDLRRQWLKKIAAGEFPEGPWSVLAKSMGGMVAIEWVTRNPGDFKKLILVNSSARNVGSVSERFNLTALPRIVKSLALFRPLDAESLIMELTVNREDLREKFTRESVALREKHPLKRETFVAQLLAATRFQAPLSLPLPTLILASEKDRLVSVECSRRLAARFEAPIRLHPTAGHDLSIDDPEWLAEEIANFLKAQVPYARRPGA